MEEEELLLGQQTEKKTMDHVIKYQDLLEKARNDHDTSIIPNDNILNTYCVLIEMLKHCNEIRIYCGEARLFTKKGIERLGQVGDKDVVKYLYSELINALNDFLSNPNKSLSIISERQPGDLLGKIKRIVLNKKNFSLSLLKEDKISKFEYHFMVGDTAIYRREISHPDKKGIVRRFSESCEDLKNLFNAYHNNLFIKNLTIA